MKTKLKSLPWLVTAMLFLTSVSLMAQDLPTYNPTPESPAMQGPTTTIEFEQTTYDFGEVQEGTVVSQVFTFTNTGDEPLIIVSARGSCGCTVPEWPREPIQPGETASITVEFNSKNKKGKRNQKVTLTANTNPPQSFIYLTGTVLYEEGTEIVIADEFEVNPPAKKNPDCFAIFPNPTAELLKLDMDMSNLGKSAIISIFSDGGQLMAKREIPMIEGTVEFNVSHYPAGTYIANVQVADQKPESRCFVVVD